MRDNKKVRAYTYVTEKLYKWLKEKRPEHMSMSAALEHYFWLGVEFEQHQKNAYDLNSS